MKYGYCRISTLKQNIERQIRNIQSAYPDAVIIQDTFTGTKINRKNFDRMLSAVKSGDIIIFDSVSRMSRNADEGIELYMQLYNQGIDLIFLKEPHINTETYKQVRNNSIEQVGNEIADIYIEATNQVLMLIARNQIKLAFEQAEKEVADLHQRTKEGIVTAKMKGKRIGIASGTKLITKKSIAAKEIIKKHSKSFGGSLADAECIKLAGISRNTFYSYKKQLKAELF